MKLSRVALGKALIAIAFVIVVLPFGLILFIHPVARDLSPRPFNAKAWQTTPHREDRFYMLDDLKQRYKLIGMTAPEVYRLLGKPDIEVSEDEVTAVHYSIKYGMGAVDKDSETSLYIDFDHGHVVKMEVFRDT